MIKQSVINCTILEVKHTSSHIDCVTMSPPCFRQERSSSRSSCSSYCVRSPSTISRSASDSSPEAPRSSSGDSRRSLEVSLIYYTNQEQFPFRIIPLLFVLPTRTMPNLLYHPDNFTPIFATPDNSKPSFCHPDNSLTVFLPPGQFSFRMYSSDTLSLYSWDYIFIGLLWLSACWPVDTLHRRLSGLVSVEFYYVELCRTLEAEVLSCFRKSPLSLSNVCLSIVFGNAKFRLI